MVELVLDPVHISIHALREEGDVANKAVCELLGLFLSTPSARRATTFQLVVIFPFGISIHALREEGDRTSGERIP